MDGFYTEPMDYDDEFLKLPCDKFVITPHNAYNSKDAVIEMERMLMESLMDVKNNVEIRNIVK
jgi:lactate dehydrogenase-like 2-hydroxyacid dehydrogenase